MTTKEVDVAIAGGGPAGMVAACLLAREGLRTLVLEAGGDFAREFRGEILQPRFQEAMRNVDLLDDLGKFPHEEIDGAHVYFHGLRVGEVQARHLDRKNPKIWWMTQPHLLSGLDSIARRSPSYEIWFGAKVTALAGPRALVVEREGGPVEVRAKVIVGADGRFSALRRLGGFEIEYDRHDLDVVWFVIERPHDYHHFFSFFVGMGNAVLILPKHPNLLQCGMVFRPGEFAAVRKKGIDAFRKRLAAAHPIFEDFAGGLRDFSEFHPLKGNRALVRAWARGGIALIGDAAHTCSPAGGIGVAIAVETACVAAQVIARGFREGDLSDARLSRIQAVREAEVREVHRFQGQARLFVSPLLAPLRVFVPLLAPILTFTRILPFAASRVLAQREAVSASFPDEWAVKDALEVYFRRSGFGRETYASPLVKLPLGPFTAYLPNPGPRREVVPLHDVSHMVGEYATDWSGELRHAGFELGMGLGRYWFGWMIDLQGIWLGLLFWPRGTLRAFARGRRSRSLYRNYAYGEPLLSMKLGEIRKALGVPAHGATPVGARDLMALAGVLGLSLAVHLPVLAAIAAGVYFVASR